MESESLWSLVSRTVSASGSIERAVFILLLGFSLVAWCITLYKLYAIYQARQNSLNFLRLFDGADCLGTVQAAQHTVGSSPLLTIFDAAMDSMRVNAQPTGGDLFIGANDPRRIAVKPGKSPEEMVLLSMQHSSKAEFSAMQHGLGFLATIGSTSPFIGLFGTVWGIMETFRVLGNAKSASLAVVAPGISSALIATAAGLAVAIPAVMAYNLLLGQIDSLEETADCFIERLYALIRASGWAQSHSKTEHVASHAPMHIPATPHAPTPQVLDPRAQRT